MERWQGYPQHPLIGTQISGRASSRGGQAGWGHMDKAGMTELCGVLDHSLCDREMYGKWRR